MKTYSITFERPEQITFHVQAETEEEAVEIAAKTDIETAQVRTFGDWEEREDLREEI